jgi:carbamoylphosphate synthase large subunit
VRSFWKKLFRSRKTEVPKAVVSSSTEVAVDDSAQLGADYPAIVIDGSDTVKAGEWGARNHAELR